MKSFGRVLLLCGWVLGGSACVDVDARDVHGDGDGDSIGRATGALTLSELAGTHGCSTEGVQALSRQLLDQMFCLAPGTLVRFEHPNIELESTRVNPYLGPEGAAAILRVAEARALHVNSALRTLAEQYVLHASCSVAATPGSSNHETGRAIDVSNWSEALSDLTSEGFTHPLPGSDDVHFEYAGEDLRSISVQAFQHLWNANHPEDLIDEDGIIGPQTNARLDMAPADGFAIDPACVVPPDAGVADASADASIDAALPDAAVLPPMAPPSTCECGVARSAATSSWSFALFSIALGAVFVLRRRT